MGGVRALAAVTFGGRLVPAVNVPRVTRATPIGPSRIRATVRVVSEVLRGVATGCEPKRRNYEDEDR